MTRLALLMAAPALMFAQTTASLSDDIDREIAQAIREGMFPGAVVIVGQKGRTLHRVAYGQRAVEPSREPMTVDTIFDVASLTKVVATVPSIMKLFEMGKVRLSDPVTRYLPEFQGGKSDITVRDLMTHFSGLRPDVDLEPAWSGYQTGIAKALVDKPTDPPGARFVYSDINYVLLGEIVRRVSGEPLDVFARKEIFDRLSMHDTGFNPKPSPRIAPTTYDPATNKMLRGTVHDPTSRYMGGVAGHAGVFTTADDLANYAEMWLGRGPYVFAPATIQKFTEAATPPDQPILRALGWDIDSPYSSNRGELYPIGSFGHTGFTGTTMWIDRTSSSFVILLSSRLHPRATPNINAVRGRIATIVARYAGATGGVSLTGYNETEGGRRTVAANHQVLTGLDVLEAENFASLKNRRIGIITNQSGLDRQGRRNIDVIKAAGIRISPIFAPEHGIDGKQDAPNIANSVDRATGLTIVSLYQNGRYRLTPEMLREVDTLVFDIQDAGARFYTYPCTMILAMEEAAKAQLPFYVLDRPNPITGVHVEGPLIDDNLQSFVGCYGLPVRHGMTVGEIATMANAERKMGLDLHVIKMKNWQRGDWFDSTEFPWIDPSPNLRSLNAATLYPGIALIESTKNYSVGRGTDAPFEQIGATWIHGTDLARFLNARLTPGVRVYPTRFTPTDSVFKGTSIDGVRFVVTNRDQFNAVRFGLEVAYALNKLYPGKIDFELSKSLLGNRKMIDALKAGEEPGAIAQRFADDIVAFELRRRPYLLY